MTEPTPAGASAPSLLSRAIGMIFSPRPTFERFLHQPKVLGVLILVGLVSGLAQGLPQLTETGRQAMLDQQVQQTERMTGRPVSDEQYAALQRFAGYAAYTTMAFTPLFNALFAVMLSGIYFVAFNVVLGGTASFKQVLAVTAHGGVIVALGLVVAAPVQYLQGTANPMGPFNLGALLPMLDETSFLARFFGFINVFHIWAMIVTAMGFSVLYRRKTGNIAIALLLVLAGMAAFFASLMGMFSGG